MAIYQEPLFTPLTFRSVLIRAWSAFLFALLLPWLGSGGSALAQNLATLIEPAVGREAAEETPSRKLLRKGGRTGLIRFDVEALADPDVHRVEIDLPRPKDGTQDAFSRRLILEFEPLQQYEDGTHTRYGRLEEIDDSYVRFSIADRSVQGVISAPGLLLWIQRFVSRANSDTSLYDLLDVHESHLAGEQKPIDGCPGVSTLQTPELPCFGQGTAVIKVLVLATEAARDAATKLDGGLDLLVAGIFADLNKIGRDSGVLIQFEKVGPIVLPGVQEVACKKMLERLREQDVASLRSQLDGDLVTLLTADASKCGARAYALNDEDRYERNPLYHRGCAFSVVQWSLARDLRSLAHEIGHNMGVGHDGKKPGLFKRSRGYCTKLCGPENVAFRTVMGTCARRRIRRFSNPSLRYRGCPTGLVGQADAASTLNALRWDISCYE